MLGLVLAVPVALALIVGALAFSEVWAGAATLPRWAPRAPYWVARALPALPFADSPAWAWVRRYVVGVSRRPTTVAPWSGASAPSQAALGAGAYLGWSDGVSGGITLHGHACSASDPLVALTLLLGATRVELERDAVHATDEDVGVGYELPLTTVSAPLPPGDYAAGALARCRSGAEVRHQLGAVRVVAPPDDLAWLALTVSSTPSGDVPAELSVVNLGLHPVRLTRIEYAPAVAATGEVIAGAVSAEQVAAWRARLRGGPGSPASPTSPSIASVVTAPPAEDGPQGLRARSATDLDLVVEPGQAAIILVTAKSLHPTRPPRPVLSHPLVLYETATGEEGGLLVRERLIVGWTGP